MRPFAITASPGQTASLRVFADLTGSPGREFSEWLRTQLTVRRISQRQLAQRSGVDHSTISRLLVGQRMPALATVVKLARVLPELGSGRDRPPSVAGLSRETASPTTLIEHALRSDDRLSEAQVGEILEHYLALRDGRSRRLRVESAQRLDDPTVAGASAPTPAASASAPS